jgi:hypothetical protein
MLWAKFVNNVGSIEEVLATPDNFIQDTLGTLPPWGNSYRNQELWQAEGWRNDVPVSWIPPEPLGDAKVKKLQEIDTWTANGITGGFISAATGESHTYDSERDDQDNIKLMHAASLGDSFESDPVYQGHVPIRAIPSGQTDKVVLMHNKAQLQALVDDMARHIGACKQKGWYLQAAVEEATTVEELTTIVWSE